MPNNCELEESKKALEDKCNALRSAKAVEEAKVRQLKEKAGILEERYEERKVAIEKKLDTMNCELAAVKNQMATAEENLKIATEEIHKCKQQIEQTREQLRQKELTFRHQIAVYEENAQHNWIKTQIWEREMAKERREAAHLKHRLDMMEGKRLLEGYMKQKPMPGRPQTQNPPRRGHYGCKRAWSFPRMALQALPHGPPFITSQGLGATSPSSTSSSTYSIWTT
ncbi:transport and Golgi organization protein 1 homolog isoform X5 [Panthera tigris]|uniref:THUMP domain-containing protein 1 isoform X6 n=1 Tax=Panthera tigris TaxID=9694 RepID=UPI001C6F8851|nr:THUMP domain-containing protein 1 isoform X6 [Panthera tigris]XP_042827997.1 transport and Golgi organization protein 1 homolog isoform X5 [Panthera tigris]